MIGSAQSAVRRGRAPGDSQAEPIWLRSVRNMANEFLATKWRAAKALLGNCEGGLAVTEI